MSSSGACAKGNSKLRVNEEVEITRTLHGSNDTVARRTCKHDGVGELGGASGHFAGAGREKSLRTCWYTVCAIMFNLSRALVRGLTDSCESLFYPHGREARGTISVMNKAEHLHEASTNTLALNKLYCRSQRNKQALPKFYNVPGNADSVTVVNASRSGLISYKKGKRFLHLVLTPGEQNLENVRIFEVKNV